MPPNHGFIVREPRSPRSLEMLKRQSKARDLTAIERQRIREENEAIIIQKMLIPVLAKRVRKPVGFYYEGDSSAEPKETVKKTGVKKGGVRKGGVTNTSKNNAGIRKGRCGGVIYTDQEKRHRDQLKRRRDQLRRFHDQGRRSRQAERLRRQGYPIKITMSLQID